MENKVYFVSDAHLSGDNDSRVREKEFCQLLDKIALDGGTLVLLGDIFDFWFSYRHVVPRGYVRLLGQLAALSDQGIKIHYFIGNHDMWMFDYLEKELAVEMHDTPCTMVFDDKRFYVGHGDGLGHLDRHYDTLKWIFRNRFNQWMFSILPECMTFGIALRWSQNSKNHHKKEDLRYLGDDREGIVIDCKEKMRSEKIDFCVFGHRHTPLVMPLSATAEDGTSRQATYVNVGDWLVHRNYAVYENGTITLHDLSQE